MNLNFFLPLPLPLPPPQCSCFIIYLSLCALLSSSASPLRPQLLWRFKFALLPMSRQPRPLSMPACLLGAWVASVMLRRLIWVQAGAVAGGGGRSTLKLLLRLRCCFAAPVLSAPKKAAYACLVFVRLLCVCVLCMCVCAVHVCVCLQLYLGVYLTVRTLLLVGNELRLASAAAVCVVRALSAPLPLSFFLSPFPSSELTLSASFHCSFLI